jgi:hypothetical protein
LKWVEKHTFLVHGIVVGTIEVEVLEDEVLEVVLGGGRGGGLEVVLAVVVLGGGGALLHDMPDSRIVAL